MLRIKQGEEHMMQAEISKDTFPVEYYAINLMELDD
jgi:hypothetical protein